MRIMLQGKCSCVKDCEELIELRLRFLCRAVANMIEENKLSLYLLSKDNKQPAFVQMQEKHLHTSFSITLLNQLSPLKSIVGEGCCVFGPTAGKAGFENFVELAALTSSSGYLVRDTARFKVWLRVRHAETSDVRSNCPEAEPYIIGGVDHDSYNNDTAAPLDSKFAAPLYLLYNINAFRQVPLAPQLTTKI